MGNEEYPDICVLGYSESAMMLRSHKRPIMSAAVCIHGQRDPVLELDCPIRLDLQFDDSPAHLGGDEFAKYRQRLQKRKPAEMGLTVQPPREEDVQAIIRFAEQTRHSGGVVLFQCHAGMSRSPAACLISVSLWLGEGAEHEAVAALRRVRPTAQPHRDMVAMADGFMRRHGRLIAAVESRWT